MWGEDTLLRQLRGSADARRPAFGAGNVRVADRSNRLRWGPLLLLGLFADDPYPTIARLQHGSASSSPSERVSNAEIGRRLYLSESTIKQHLRSAYKLLGVSNRTEAANLVRRSAKKS